ncbi:MULTISPECIES: iron ABC transporter permease [Jeotgalicoccus]|uniref:ABC transporter permease n=1 Tax=Jeotgalicoccus TaxID=227979 RepID=UPI000566DDB0|nr:MULTISPECIES: ABC transporter permease subunit [Jeotgalicoccus]
MKFSGKFYAYLVTGVLFVMVFLPLLAVILNAILPGLFFGELDFNSFTILFEVFERQLWLVSLKNSLILGIGGAFLGVLVGFILAYFRARWSFLLGKWLDLSAWILLIIPSFMIAQGWLLFANRTGMASSVFGWEWVTDFIFQPVGLIFIMGMTKFPLAYLTIVAAMEWNVSQLDNAAKLNGAKPFTVLRTIQLPLAMPSVVAGWTLVFIDIIGDFGLPAALSTLYRFPTLPYSIYTAINQSPVRFDMAGVLSFYLVLILVFAMLILFIATKKSKVDFLGSTASRTVRVEPKNAWLVNLITLVLLLICLGIPVFTSVSVSFMDSLSRGLVFDNLTFDNYRTLFAGGDNRYAAISSVFEGLKNSISLAIIAALISMILAFTVTFVLVFTESKMKGPLQVFTVISLAVPGVVLGIGYIFIWNQRWLEPLGLNLYGTPTLLVIAAVAGAIPYAVRIQLGAVSNVSPVLLQAASVQGASVLMRMSTILLPIVRNTLLIATLASFGSSVFDLAIASMLQPPNYTLLPIVIDRAFEVGDYGYATAASVLGAAVVVLIIIAVQIINSILSRLMENNKKRKIMLYESNINRG